MTNAQMQWCKKNGTGRAQQLLITKYKNRKHHKMQCKYFGKLSVAH